MADEKTFDPQPSLETEPVAVQDFETGSFANNQFSNGAAGNVGSNTGGTSMKDAQPLNTPEDSLKEKHPEKNDKPTDESFKVFTPEIPGCLSSDAILYSVEKVPVKSLISEDRKSEKSIENEGLKQEIVSFFNEVRVPWSYEDEVNRIEKKKEEDFNAKYQPLPLPEQVVGRLTIKEESKNWYKIAFGGTEGYVQKKHVEIEALDWLTKSYQKEIGDETIKAEKKKELDEKLKGKEAEKIKKEEGTPMGSELKDKLFQFSKLSLKITTEERKLKEAKEAFEKRLKKREKKDKNVDKFFRRSHYTEAIHELATALKKNILKYNEINQFIKTEREKLLTPEEKAIVKEYKIKILDEQEDKKTDDLDPEVIIKDIENKVLMSSDELKQYEEGKKQEKLNKLEKELEDPGLDDEEKAKKREEIKRINNPTPATKPEDFARKEILLYANKNYQVPKSTEEKKALLHYLMKASELTKEEKMGLFNFMVLFFKDGDDVAKINEVFGYDGDKIDPKAFVEKFSDLEFTMPSDLIRDQLNENKKTYKKERKTRRKASNSFKERRAWRKNLKADFKEKRAAIKAPRKSLKDQSQANRKGFRSDKRALRKTKGTDKNYKDKRAARKREFKDKREGIREEKRKNPVFLRSLWQKSRNDSAYGSINERLNYLGNNRAENQANVKLVRDNKRKRSRSAFETKDKQMLAFARLMEHGSNFYLDAYELEYLRRTEGDTEKLQEKSVRFYETYFKGKPDLEIGYQNPYFDLDPTLFYKFIVLPGLLFKAFPEKYYQNDIPSKPSEVKDDLLRFWYSNDFARFEKKDESLEDASVFKSEAINIASNINPDKLNLDWFEFIQANPGNYLQAYELEKFLDKEGVSLSEKQEQLFAFYKLYEKQFNKGGAGFANKEALWAKWGGDPTAFFKYLYPPKYFKDDKLVPPTQVYMDLWDALKTGALDTILEEVAMKSLGDYLGKKTGDHLGKNYLAYGIPTFLALAGSDVLFKDSNFYTSFPEELLGIAPAYFTLFAPFNKTLIDYKRTTPWGNNLSSTQHKLRFSNQPFGEKGILPTYPSPPGRSGELKPDQNSLANYQGMFETDPKKMLPSLYAALNYDFLKNRTENSKLMNQTTLSATGFGQFFTPMRSKLGEDKDSYSMLAQGYPIIRQNTPDFGFNKDTTWEDLTLAKFTGREKNEAYLNSIPDYPVFNYGAGLSVAHRPSKNLELSSSLNYAGINVIPGMNNLKKMDLWSGKTAISINTNPIGYWKVNANLNYDWAYTRDLTPDPNSTSQDAVNGIGQQHTLTGNLTIGNGFCEFTGAFSDDLMRGKDATTFTLRFSVNQFADIPKGVFSAQVFMEKRAPVPSLGIPSVLSGGVKLVFNLGNILPHQPK